MIAKKINVMALKYHRGKNRIVELFVAQEKELSAAKWRPKGRMLPIEEIYLSSDEDLNFNELERSWSKTDDRLCPAANATARVMRCPRGFGFEAILIPDCFVGYQGTAKKEAEKLK